MLIRSELGSVLLGVGPGVSGAGPGVSGAGPAMSGAGPDVSGAGPDVSWAGPDVSGAGLDTSGAGSGPPVGTVESGSPSFLAPGSRNLDQPLRRSSRSLDVSST